MKDLVLYIDTDSLFCHIGGFLESQEIPMDKWNALPQETKTDYIIKISKQIEKSINERMYNKTQREDYNSTVDKDVFSIQFKQEIVCSSALFINPKMYTFRVINEEGFSCDKVDSKGIEVVRSTSPKMFRATLKELIKRILAEEDDDTLIDFIEDSKKEFYNANPEDVSINVSVNNFKKYVNEDNTYIKGTPYNLKGAVHFHILLDKFKLSNRYQKIQEGDKCKFIYLKQNMYGIDSCSFYEWPKEFEKLGIIPDISKMIEKYFTNKASILLEPINRQKILDGRSAMDEFF